MLAVYIIYDLICTSEADHLLFAELLSTSIFVTGIATFVQVTFGVRWVHQSFNGIFKTKSLINYVSKY